MEMELKLTYTKFMYTKVVVKPMLPINLTQAVETNGGKVLTEKIFCGLSQ